MRWSFTGRKVGDTVACYATLQKVGRSSMTIGVEVWINRPRDGTHQCVTSGVFTYVALDESGKPTPVQS